MMRLWGNSHKKAQKDIRPYSGIERRVYQRRVGTERREMVRFEPGKEDRRCGTDRRAGASCHRTITPAQVCQIN